jgi:outer membrane protein assembly factor BamA
MRRLWLPHRCFLICGGGLLALLACGVPAHAERQFIPIPEVIVDPNEGTTVGLLGVVLMSNEDKSIGSIVAPDVRYNDSFGVYPTFRYFGYPDPNTHFSIIAGKATKQGEDAEAEYSGQSMLSGWLDLVGHVQHEEDPFERFYGFGNNTPSQNETNFGSTTNSGRVFGGLNVYGPWQVSLALRLSEERIGHGGVNSLPQLRDPSSGFSTVNGADGATVVGTRFGLNYDTRDRRDIPTEGVFAAAGIEPVDEALGSSGSYIKYDVVAKGFLPLRADNRIIIALHSELDYVQHGDEAPFYELSSIGGIHSLRGFGSHRYTDNNRFVFQGELRSNVYEREIFGVLAHLEVAPFLDMGEVFHSSREFPLEHLHPVGGCGFRAVVVPQVVAYVDIGTAGGSPAAFTGIDYPF